MKQYRVTVLVVVGFLIVTGILMIRATATGTAIVLTPLEVQEKQRDLPRVRVAGRISEGEKIEYVREPHVELRFGVVNPGGGKEGQTPLKVVYRGLKPDMFAIGRDVILEGEVKGGSLYASTLLTQCPSKYEPPSPTGEFNK